MSTEYRIASPHLAQFVQAIWRQAGSTAREAELVADHLVQANLAGHDSHGVGMIPSYMASLAQGQLQLNQHAEVVRNAGAVLTLDGARGFGQVVASEAMALGIERAGKLGLAAVALHNAHHIGRIGHWRSSAPAPALSRFISSTWWAIRWWRRSAAAIAASAPTRSAPFSRGRAARRCC